MKSKYQLMYLIITCVALMALSGVCAYAANLVKDSSLESLTVGTTQTSGWQSGDWAFGLSPDSGGSMEVVSDAHTGSKAVKLSRTSTAGDAAFGLWSTTDHAHMIPVVGGHRYIVRVWAKSPDAATLRFQVASFNNIPTPNHDDGWLGDTVLYTNLPTQTNWTLYQMTYDAPANALFAGVSVRVINANTNLYIDDFSLDDASASVPNLFPDSSFGSFVAGNTCTAATTYVGMFKITTSGTGNGSVSVITPGQDGDTAIRLTRATSAGDININLQTSTIDPRIPVVAGHTYRFSFWAKSDVTGEMQLTISSYKSDKSKVSDTQIYYAPSATWAQYSGDYTPASTVAYWNITFRPSRDVALTRSVDIDNVSVVDVTPSTLTGTVVSGLSGQTVSGATVTVTSATQTFTTTTDTNGVYTFNEISAGMWNLSVSANGYATWHSTSSPSGYDIELNGTLTKDASLMPESWAVTDTFTRTAGADLGNTEDANAIPWVKTTGNTSSTIDTTDATAGRLRFDIGASACGASLGRNFMPADFDMSVDMSWDINQYYSVWAAFVYRQSSAGAYNQGYFLKCPYTDGDGNTTLELYYNDGANSTKLGSGTIQTSYLWGNGATLRVRATGDHHTVWVDGNKVMDVVDSHKTSGGYVGLFCDKDNIVYWDNLNVAYSAPTNVGSITDAKALVDGTKVAVAETLVATIPSSTFNDGSYYLENVDRAYGIKVINGEAVSAGSRITGLIGTINTDANGERYIDAFDMNVATGDPIGALGMNNKAAVESLAQGMLVNIWGNVTSVAEDKSYFYINDGSNVSDGTNDVGIRVDYSNSTVKRLATIAVGESVAITGVMGLGNDGTATIKVIRPKSSLDVTNTVVDTVTVSSSDMSWICQVAEGTGTVAFATAPDSKYGSGAVLMTNAADGSTNVINLRTNLHAGTRLADLTELSISNYMTYFDTANTNARGVGARISLDLDGVLDTVDDIITCDPWNDHLTGSYGYSLCALNKWVAFDALNVGRWYSGSGYAGSSDAGPFISIAAYLAVYPDARIASVSNGGLRFFMGGCTPHWDNVTGYVDNVRVGTVDGTTVYNFE